MPKEKTRFIVKRNGKLYVRVSYKDSTGKSRELMRRAKDRAEAKALAKQLVAELEKPNSEQVIEGSRMRFADLASIFTESKLTAPEIKASEKLLGCALGNVSLVFSKHW